MVLYGLFAIFKNLFYLFLSAFGITFLIAIHEFGHFLFCKIFGIKTPSFSIGFGPRIFEKKIGDTVFALSAIPLGGYVEIAGAQEVGQGEQEHAQSQESWSFARKPYWQKLCVLLGGILFNILFAYLATSAIFYQGIPKTPMLMPQNTLPIINEVSENTPASRASLQPKDVITAINETTINKEDVGTLLKAIHSQPHQTVTLSVQRGNEVLKIPVTLEGKKSGKKEIGFLGASFELFDLPPKPLGEAIAAGIRTTNTLIVRIFKAFGNLLTRDGFNQVGGPLMIGWQLTKSAESSFLIFLLLLAFISINLAVLNVFPLPVLDGGQVLFYTIEAITGRQLPDRVRLIIHYISWVLAISLLVFVFFKDLHALIGKMFGL